MFYKFCSTRLQVKCVVVGFDLNFTYLKLARATSYLQNKDCLFVATNTDAALPMNDKVAPGNLDILPMVMRFVCIHQFLFSLNIYNIFVNC